MELNQFLLEKKVEVNNKIIIAGDFNCILNEIDKKGGNIKLKENVVNNINEIIDTFELVDIWRLLNPNELRFTWRQTIL